MAHLDAVPASDTDRVGGGEVGEGLGVVAHLLRRLEEIEVNLEGRSIVERAQQCFAAVGHQHRLAHRGPAVAHSHPQRSIGADRRGHNRAAHHPLTVQLAGLAHRQIIAGAAAHQWHIDPGCVIGTAHHFHLVAAQSVGEQHHHCVLAALQSLHATGRLCGGLAQALLLALPPAGAHPHLRSPQSPEHQRLGEGACGGDLAGGGAADHVATGKPLLHSIGQAFQRIARGCQHDQQPWGVLQLELVQGLLQGTIGIVQGG